MFGIYLTFACVKSTRVAYIPIQLFATPIRLTQFHAATAAHLPHARFSGATVVAEHNT